MPSLSPLDPIGAVLEVFGGSGALCVLAVCANGGCGLRGEQGGSAWACMVAKAVVFCRDATGQSMGYDVWPRVYCAKEGERRHSHLRVHPPPLPPLHHPPSRHHPPSPLHLLPLPCPLPPPYHHPPLSPRRPLQVLPHKHCITSRISAAIPVGILVEIRSRLTWEGRGMRGRRGKSLSHPRSGG